MNTEELYKRATKQTIDTLPAFMEEVLSQEQTYESIVESIAICTIAAAWAANKHPNGGITWWQASYVMWEFIFHYLDKKDSVGMRLVDYDDMLYPQYYDAFNKKLKSSTFKALQKKAQTLLDEGGGADLVRKHWQSIVNGEVPFGYTLYGDDE